MGENVIGMIWGLYSLLTNSKKSNLELSQSRVEGGLGFRV